MNLHLKLHFLKQLINLFTKFLDRILGDVPASYPQTRIFSQVLDDLKAVVKVEVSAGRFNDRNFERLLRVLGKALMYVAEHDSYYRQWLALAMWLSRQHLNMYVAGLSYEDFVLDTRRQWKLNFSIVGRHHFEAHREELAEVVLTDFLCNLVPGGSWSEK